MDRKRLYSILTVLALTLPCHGDLLHHWRLDEDTTATDVASDSAGGLDGTIQGPTSVEGNVDMAFSFDGSDDTVEIQEFTPPSQGTIALWIHPALAKNKERFLGAGGDYELWLRGNGELKNELFDGGSATLGTGPGAVEADEWYHLAATYDSATTAVEIYLNGELNVAGTAEEPSTPTGTTLLFGHRPSASAGECYGGLLDDIQVYDEVLAADQIQGLYEYPGSTLGEPTLTAGRPDPANGAYDVVVPLLQWRPGMTAVLHDVYVGTDPDLGPEDLVQGRIPMALCFYGPGVTPGTTYYWRVDEIEADMTTVHVGEVWSFLAQPLTAYMPEPADGACNAPSDPNMTLNWLAGLNASEHHVYFGDSFDDVNAGVAGTDEGTTTERSFAPGQLEPLSTYYWRVDEIDALANVEIGAVWSFTTYRLVDDFESYDDDMEFGTTVFDAWVDGLTNGTGSYVGYEVSDNGTFGETQIVFRGGQSMPMEYSNVESPHYSEARHEFATDQDWTVDQIDTLIVHVRGQSSNEAAPLYVGLTDSSNRTGFVTHPDPEAAKSVQWIEWEIPLSQFADAGVDLSGVKSMVIGLGERNASTPGGVGRIYVDEIWLTRAAPAATQ